MTRLAWVCCLIAACDGSSGATDPAPEIDGAPPPAMDPATIALTPAVAAQLLITDVQQPPHRITIPPPLFNKGLTPYWGIYKICVDAQGAVADVTILQGATPRDGHHRPGTEILDPFWIQTMKGWRYRPHQVDGRASPFCYPTPVEAPRPVFAAEQLKGAAGTAPPMRLTDINGLAHQPPMPPELVRSSFVLWGLYEFCLGTEGQVMDVRIIKRAHDVPFDERWIEKIKTWRYQPAQPTMENGQTQAACHVERLEARVL